MNKFLASTIFIITLALLFSACSTNTGTSAEREKVFLADEELGENNELAIDDTAIRQNEIRKSIEQTSSSEPDKIKGDGSKITTMYDGYGNKTERRFFNQHPFLQAMVLRTSAAGQKEILLFGHNGEVKTVPPEMLDRAMTATADELAKAAGILQGRKTPTESFSVTGNFQTDNSAPLSAVSDHTVRQTAEETKIEQTGVVEKQEIQNPPPDIKTAEAEYRSAMKNLSLRTKKNQMVQNAEKVNRN